MANADGGVLAIGVSDKTRRIEGIDRICNELESRGSVIPSFHTEAFILKAILMAEFVEDVPQNVRQDSQSVPQGVPQDKELDSWIEHQVIRNPKITSEELASLSGRSSKTIIRHIAKMPHIKYVGSGYSGHWEVVKQNDSKD